MWPHRQQPTRLRHPWDSPGKNTGLGWYFPLQCMKVKSESEVAQSCPTLSDPMDCSLSGSSVHGFSRQEYWSGVPLPSLRPKSIRLPLFIVLSPPCRPPRIPSPSPPSPPLIYLMQIKASQEGGIFVSPEALTPGFRVFLCSHFAGFSLCLLATTIWDS